MRHSLAILTTILTILAASVSHGADSPCRYFRCGDGILNLATNKGSMRFYGQFRNADGTYDEAAMGKINRVFSAKYGVPISTISPRLIEFIDFLQDHYAPNARVTITSGYRSPSYNTGLRNKGKLAAKASLHQYGMAADLWIAGVPSEKIWYFVRELGFGGVGYYHGRSAHVDVGPARFWDETTSKVGTDISDDNKLIAIVTDMDIYSPGEAMEMRFIRMTTFPIGVNPAFVLEAQRKDKWKEVEKFSPTFAKGAEGSCPRFNDIGEMLGIRWKLPEKLKPGRYRIRVSFCEKEYADMPEEIETPEFEVRKP